MAINLRQFGLNWSLNPPKQTFIMPLDYVEKINTIKYLSDDKSALRFSGVTNNVYTFGKKLGGGTYGTVYECTRESDKLPCCIKVINNIEIRNLIKEAIIQIIIVETTKNKQYPDLGFNGPFAPIIYDIAYDKSNNTGYLVCQQMKNTFSKMLENREGHPDLMKATAVGLIQISTMLSELYKTLNFNHRDFKSDNCMYIRDEQNRIQMRLIDFGFSYIKYKGLIVRSTSYDFDYDSLPSRDMTQIMYELYHYHKYLPNKIRGALADLLTFPYDNSVCKMYSTCNKMKEWKHTYTFLNNPDAFNPNGDADVVKKVFMKIYRGLDYKSDLAYAPGLMGLFVAKPAVPLKCPIGKIFNPITGRCVFATGAVGKKLLKEVNIAKPDDKNDVAKGLAVKACPTAKPDYNPMTKRCVKACPSGKKRNSTTFKCVKSTVKPLKVCPSEKPDYNPKTKRCNKACPPGKKRNVTFKCVNV